MSNLNLWPWRERQRQEAMRRWAWGLGWMLLASAGADGLVSLWQVSAASSAHK